MKKLKALIAIALLTVMSLTVLSFAACGGEKEPPPPEGKVCYTYEAEDVDLTGLSGPVYSGEASEWKMVCGENTSYIKNNYPKVLESISNGYFISYFNGKGTILNFIFTSNKACTGNELRIRLASECQSKNDGHRCHSKRWQTGLS